MASNRIKGLTIEINGDTTDLSESLRKVDTQLKDTQSKLRDVNKLLKLDPKNTELLAQKQKLLKQQVDDTKDRLKQLNDALKQMDASGADKASSQYQALQREIVDTEQKLKAAETAAKNFGTTTTRALKDVSDKAKAVQEKTALVSTAAAGAVAGMVGMAAKAASTADDLLTLSNVTGFSVEELQKLQYASDFVDVSMDTMTGSIQKLTKNMASGSDAFDKLGISITDNDGNMRNATDVWYEALEALGQIENETERDQISMELFGKSAMDMAGIVDDGGAALRQLGEDAEATGNILSQDAVEDAVAFNDQIDEVKAKAEQAFLSAGAALAEELLPALETLVDVITGVLEWFGNLDGGTQTFILTILGLVAAISPIAGIVSTLTGLAAGLNVAMLPMIGTIGAIVLAVAGVIAAGVALYQNWDTIKQKAGEVWQAVTEKFEAIRSAISEKIDAAKEAVRTAIETIKGFFNFQWKWPKIPLPHFSIKGSMNPLDWISNGVPKISVSWYKKAMQDAYLLNGATIFGMSGNRLLGGGEAGKEVILGLDKLKDYAGSNVMNFNMVINAAPGQSERELAKMVSKQIQNDILKKKAVWG